MKTTPRVNPSCFWLLILLALSVAVVATSMSPGAAEARARSENMQPLPGDPTDTNDGPAPTSTGSAVKGSAVKSPTLSRYSSTTDSGRNPQSLASPTRLYEWTAYLNAFRLRYLVYWDIIR